ncbi:MAG TPA: hypothetical protein VMT70_05880 [Vicinamibacteria bacterium]|nr:hypothetical protein [Vicinamibacteria bacterium]
MSLPAAIVAEAGIDLAAWKASGSARGFAVAAEGKGEMMAAGDGTDVFWLNFTNIALGLVTLLAVVAVAAGVLHELSHRLARRKALVDDHTFEAPGLGVTMADGGERLDRD